MNYGPDCDPLEDLGQARPRHHLGLCPQNRDYHRCDQGQAQGARGGFLVARAGGDVKVFVDTAPVMEKPLAEGRRSRLAGQAHGAGSRANSVPGCFLGAILTTAELPPDAPESDHCGSCRRCLDICPTNAFPRALSARCTALHLYLTIEHKGHIDRDLRPGIGNRIFGCERLSWPCGSMEQVRAGGGARAKLRQRKDLARLPLDELGIPRRYRFPGALRGDCRSSVTGRDRFLRNVF